MKLTPITIDFETFWSDTHSLSKMTNIAYVTHADTEIISASIKISNGPTQVYFGEPAIKRALHAIPQQTSMGIGHNMSGFDALICAWRFNWRPKMWGCTAAMARSQYAKTCGVSLAKLSTELGIGVKDSTALHNTKGKYLADFTDVELADMAEYNKEDTELCYRLFCRLVKGFPVKELWQIHATTQMLVNPQFELDTTLVRTALTEEQENKARAIMKLSDLLETPAERAEFALSNGPDTEERMRIKLASAAKFGELLVSQGLEVPMKVSPTNPEKLVPALAKTDEAFIKLQDHPNPIVSAACRARLAVKSTLLETRLKAFDVAAQECMGKLPIPLRYAGADTTGRWSGEIYNAQNLPRIPRDKDNNIVHKTSNALRLSMMAPPGFKVVVSDLSGIEMRVNHFLWKVPSTMELYRGNPKADLYRASGALAHNCAPEEVTKEQRQIEKIKNLGLGFGAGAATFQKIAKLMGGMDIDLDQSQDWVNAWRRQYHEIADGWKTCHAALECIVNGPRIEIDPWGLCTTDNGGIRLPSGRKIWYPSLHTERADGKSEWWYGAGRHRTRIYAGKIDENCIAAGTLVLTHSGWKPIEDITVRDMVHDGVEFVRHDGMIFKSVQSCVIVDGVYMTPNHEVLTDDGWQEASQVQEPFRPTLRGAVGGVPRNEHGQSMEVAVPVRLRESDGQIRVGCIEGNQARGNPELRVSNSEADLYGKQNPWDVQAPCIRGVSVNDGPVPATVAPRMGKLWRAWNRGMQSLGCGVLQFLGGHGARVPAGVGFGPQGQQRPVLSRQLPVGFSSRQQYEQAEHGPRSGHYGAESLNRNKSIHAVLPHTSRVPAGQTLRETITSKPVYDIVNCGPRHRFVVLGDEGPFIVHNCVQALARDVIADVAYEFNKTVGFEPALSCHDELVYVLPESIAESALVELDKQMRTPPKWWPELITWSEGDVADSYGLAK